MTTEQAPTLTRKEREALVLVLSEGKSAVEAGEAIGKSKRTIEFHLHNAYQKLKVTNRVQALKKCIDLKILDPARGFMMVAEVEDAKEPEDLKEL
jgi:DNA-binding CsgD family transcriptional regulator